MKGETIVAKKIIRDYVSKFFKTPQCRGFSTARMIPLTYGRSQKVIRNQSKRF